MLAAAPLFARRTTHTSWQFTLVGRSFMVIAFVGICGSFGPVRLGSARPLRREICQLVFQLMRDTVGTLTLPVTGLCSTTLCGSSARRWFSRLRPASIGPDQQLALHAASLRTFALETLLLFVGLWLWLESRCSKVGESSLRTRRHLRRGQLLPSRLFWTMVFFGDAPWRSVPLVLFILTAARLSRS